MCHLENMTHSLQNYGPLIALFVRPKAIERISKKQETYVAYLYGCRSFFFRFKEQ